MWTVREQYSEQAKAPRCLNCASAGHVAFIMLHAHLVQSSVLTTLLPETLQMDRLNARSRTFTARCRLAREYHSQSRQVRPAEC